MVGMGAHPAEGLLVRQKLEARWARKRMVSNTSIVLAWPSLFCWPGTYSKSVSLPHEIVFCKRAQQKEGKKHLAVTGGAHVTPGSSCPSPLPGKKKEAKRQLEKLLPAAVGTVPGLCVLCFLPSALTWLSRGLIKGPGKVQSSSCLGASLNPRGNLRFAVRAHRDCGPVFHKSN